MTKHSRIYNNLERAFSSEFGSETLDGDVTGTDNAPRSRRPPLKADEVSVRWDKASGIYGVTFNSSVADETKDFKYVVVYRSRITRKAFFVFNNAEGVEVKRYSHVKAVAFGQRLAAVLLSVAALDAGGRIKIGKNISGRDFMATYEIITEDD